MKSLKLNKMELLNGGCNKDTQAFAAVATVISCGFAFAVPPFGALIAGPSCLASLITTVDCIYDAE